MSLQFSDVTNRNGIIQKIEDDTNTGSNTTSSFPLVTKTREVNLAYARYFVIAQRNEGAQQADDTNQTKQPIITFNLVSGQRDYSYTVDEQGNQITSVYKIRIKDSAGNWKTLTQRDLSSPNNDDQWLNTTVQGTPSEYDISGNTITFDVIPNYNSTGGGEIYISRTPVYFVSTDTTKVPGIPDEHHEYLALRPAYFYCLRKGLPQANALGNELLKYEGSERLGITGIIEDFYAHRNHDQKSQIKVVHRSSR